MRRFTTEAIRILTRRKIFRIRLFFKGLMIGIFTGVTVAALRFLLDEADIFRLLWFQNFGAGKFFVTLIFLIFVAKFLERTIRFDKQVAGSGVPQIKAMLQGVAGMYKSLRLIFLKFMAVVLGIGAGLSLGRADL